MNHFYIHRALSSWSRLLSHFQFSLGRLPGGGGGGHSIIWPIRGCAAAQGMFFWPLCPEQGIQFYAIYIFFDSITAL